MSVRKACARVSLYDSRRL